MKVKLLGTPYTSLDIFIYRLLLLLYTINLSSEMRLGCNNHKHVGGQFLLDPLVLAWHEFYNHKQGDIWPWRDQACERAPIMELVPIN
jgi:hypothetical protein